jgi:hypothetical protein
MGLPMGDFKEAGRLIKVFFRDIHGSKKYRAKYRWNVEMPRISLKI